MVDQGLVDKSDFNSDLINKLLVVNESITKPAFINVDDERYLIDYQDNNGYKTYAIVNDNKVYGFAYDSLSDAVSMLKNDNVYKLNQEKLLQKYNSDDYLEEELNYYITDDNNKMLIYTKLLDNGFCVLLRYIANYSDDKILLNYLYNHLKRPDLIIITKEYFKLGRIHLYKKKSLDFINDHYITRGKYRMAYTKEQVDDVLSRLNLPSFIPQELLSTYLDKDNSIKTLKRVINKYEDNYLM